MHGRSRPLVCACVIVACVAPGCSSSSPPTSPEPPPNADGEPIAGTERLGWQLAASSAPDGAGYVHSVFVDGQRVELKDVSCTAISDGTYTCASPMPRLSPGRHVLEVAVAFRDSGVESPRSAPLVVMLPR